jgi:excisionase family DNA binding protein
MREARERLNWSPAITPPTDADDMPHRGGSSGRRLLTAGQVAELLGVPQTWVYEQSRAGRIPTVTLGRYRRYRREAIEAWLVELETAASRGPKRRVPR